MRAKGRKADKSGLTKAVRVGRASDAAPTSSLPPSRAPDGVPAGWLERLFSAMLALPLVEGDRAVTESLVEAVAGILPEHAVGACIVSPAASGGASFVVTRLPVEAGDQRSGIDPTRVFPGFAHEYVLPLAAAHAGSTLHVASDGDPLDGPGSPAVQLLERVASVLERSLGVARQLSSVAASQRQAPPDFTQRMLQADKLATFGQIAAGVVHELNNPLTSIVAYSDYLTRKALADGAPHEPDDVDRLRRISESANRMLRFTRDFVAYARPSAGARGPVVLHGVIDQAIAFCEHVLGAAHTTVERQYAHDVLAVRGVAEQLVQVFVNLLTNAAHAAPARGGRIRLATRLDTATRRIVIRVADNGGGISGDHLRKIFVPFFTTKGDRHGTGLGLSIVKNILEEHEGTIRAESEPGAGATFVLELPAWQRA